eukprot:TRINITY_DN1689_c0_g1_i1.p1 TRINITY_DN1689_c0_g1~~TRINITY_DN1689_c0_g1_i1.p1  ORF type:complete len:885 (-),score=320.50 TRINITY_DN1689_c0_g1_i1:213-2867(-)
MSSKKRIFLNPDSAYNPAANNANNPPPQTYSNNADPSSLANGFNGMNLNNNSNEGGNNLPGSSPFMTPANATPLSPSMNNTSNFSGGFPSPLMNPGVVNGPSYNQPRYSNQASPPNQPSMNHNKNTGSPILGGVFGSGTPKGDEEVIPLSVDPETQCPDIYFKPTFRAIPQSHSLLQKASIPFAAIVTPLARPTNENEVIPVCGYGISGIVRCRRCRIYINPFVAFLENGRKWRCNFCSMTNDVPGDYYSPLDVNGRRVDLKERPELRRGLVEFLAPPEYTVRPPQPATYFFIIDASYYAISSGMFHMTVETIRRTLDEFPGSPRTRVGFLTFNNSLQFYTLRSSGKPQMMVVSDLTEVFLPVFPDDLLVNLVDSRSVVETLLSKLPSMFPPVAQNADSCYGMALKAGFEVIKSIGGKLVTFVHTLPTLGEGKLANREDPKFLGTDKEALLYLPSVDDRFYKDLAMDCSGKQISIDTFVFSGQNFADVATISSLSQFTGGENYFFPSFRSDKDGEKLFHTLRENIKRETGFEGVFRVRASRGIKVEGQHGNFFVRQSDLLNVPNMDADKSITFQFALQDSTINTKFASFQTALLYTTSFGERRIRSFTVCMPVTTSLSDVFKTADVEAIATVLTKLAIDRALTSSKLNDARESVMNKIVDILAVYKTDLATKKEGSTLLLPESLKLLPLYIMALFKHTAFRQTVADKTRPDERTYLFNYFRMAPSPALLGSIYPQMYPLVGLGEEVGTQNEGGFLSMPPVISLTSEQTPMNGAYLLEDGQQMLLWVRRQCDPDWYNSVIGVDDVSQLNGLPVYENSLSQRMNVVVSALRARRPNFMPLRIYREGDGRDFVFTSRLIEDANGKDLPNYYAFLCMIHERINTKLKK